MKDYEVGDRVDINLKHLFTDHDLWVHGQIRKFDIETSTGIKRSGQVQVTILDSAFEFE